MSTAARVLDDHRFEARARIGDIVALGVIVVVGAALLFGMYTLGYSAGEVAQSGGQAAVVARDRGFVYMLIEMAIVIMALAWIVYRLFTHGARRVGG